VLLVTGSSIPAPIATELTRLQPRRVVVLGASGVISEQLKLALGAYEAP
jgi:hypothetical protein